MGGTNFFLFWKVNCCGCSCSRAVGVHGPQFKNLRRMTKDRSNNLSQFYHDKNFAYKINNYHVHLKCAPLIFIEKIKEGTGTNLV